MSEPYPPATGRPEPPGRLTQRTDSLTEAGELLSGRVCDETTHTSVIPVGELDLSTAGAFDHWVAGPDPQHRRGRRPPRAGVHRFRWITIAARGAAAGRQEAGTPQGDLH
jgi:hypothetical protein